MTTKTAPHRVAESRIVSDAPLPAVVRSPVRHVEPTVKDIIAAARAQPTPARGALMLVGVSAALLWASFTPLDWSPLAWIALVPLCVLIRVDRAPRWLGAVTFLGGIAFWLPTLQWLRLGDVAMYTAWIALTIYEAAYWTAFVGLSRAGVHRFGVPLTFAAPLVWTGLEFVRGRFMTGFAWYFLGHTQYRWIELIQISDICGAFGVSFVVAMSNAMLAGLIPNSWLQRLKLTPPLTLPKELSHLPQPADERTSSARCERIRQIISVAACLSVLAATLAYGFVRRGQAAFQSGPRVALIQGNFTSSLKHDPESFPRIYETHKLLTGYAVPHKPDIIVWPETMFRWKLTDADPQLSDSDLLRLVPEIPVRNWRDPYVRNSLSELSQMTGANLVIGLERFHAAADGLKHFNSAVHVTPERGIVGTFDKMHRVIFGEYVPLKETFPWLKSFSPMPDELSLTAGPGPVAFDCGRWRVAPLICFEDTVPHLVRDIVRSTSNGTERVECLLNLTNDGWFHGSSELDQHLITSAFRAVECRTPLVRAVNTGISAVIDGDGMIREPEVFIDGDATWNHKREQMQQAGRDESLRRTATSMFDPVRSTLIDPATGRWRKSLNAALIDTVPLDSRTSLYVKFGDWFAGTCAAACGLFLLIGVTPKRWFTTRA